MDFLEKIVNEEIEKIKFIDKVDLYKSKGCSDMILKILKQNKNPKKFGIMMENIIKNYFELDVSDTTECDCCYKGMGIEIKSSTLLSSDLLKNKYTYQYNSIRKFYKYDYLMICNINITGLDFYIIDKKTFWEYIDSLKIKQKKLKIGILEMICYKRIKDIMIKINNRTDLLEYFEKN
tara:strand:- start:266 stop:799 length:534 start_codon:yes stop_codon:yes gene_type:complete